MTYKMLACFLLALCAVGLGCNSNSNTAPVAGTVTYQGQPLKEGTITFIPKNGKPGYGKIVDGKIAEVTTEAPQDGAPLGPNQVTIQAVQGAGDMYAVTKSLIPDIYAQPGKSGLSANIEAGKTNELKFELQ